jgi:type VI protein secretion system component VasK
MPELSKCRGCVKPFTISRWEQFNGFTAGLQQHFSNVRQALFSAAFLPHNRPVGQSPHNEPRYDFSWRRGNLLAVAALCLLAGAALAWWSAGRSPAGDVLPVDQARAAAASQKVDPNTASVASLRRLPMLGPQRAADIVAYRAGCSQSRPFARAEDLAKVHGIGPGIVEQLRPYLEFAGAQASSQ